MIGQDSKRESQKLEQRLTILKKHIETTPENHLRNKKQQAKPYFNSL